MDQRIKQALEGKQGSYILPFFWQHGEDEATLRDYMRAIYEANIREVCVECRPHPDFCGPKWWQDLDVILDEARARGMRVWILDDDHFPTGHCNGALENADPQLCKQYLTFKDTEAVGPAPGTVVDVDAMLHPAPLPFPAPTTDMFGQPLITRDFDDDRPLKLVACRMVGGKLGETIDLTAQAVESGWGQFAWDVPEGHWKLYAVYLTHNGGGRPDYFNICDRDSVRVLIDTVYEAHYARYKDDFGKTVAGFFSDEPLVGNTPAYQPVDAIVGHSVLPLTWCPELTQTVGEDFALQAPLLWFEGVDAGQTAAVRCRYMDVLTRLIEKNFSKQIGDWCAAHGVEYIGHLVEDNNVSFGLGSSLGHYFRGLNGQHFAGVDATGGQVFPGGEDRVGGGGFPTPYYPNGTWYHFVLGKLGSSHSHIDPRKQGRAMCELFGAYGWGFGVRDMKYLADHMMVRGINRLVPHAFSPAPFPDPDCPPHFYAHGENPQYRHFATLMAYCQRVCHLIDGGQNVPDVAVLYEGESIWAGRADFIQDVCRTLAEHQIDYDILPADVFNEKNDLFVNAQLQDGKLVVNGREYGALILSSAAFVPAGVAAFSRQAEAAGFPVLCVDRLPAGLCEGGQADFRGKAISLEELAPCLADQAGVRLSKCFPGLRVYHYRGEGDRYLLSNESTGSVFEGEVSVADGGEPFLYDPLANALRPVESRVENGRRICQVKVEPYELLVLGFDAEAAPAAQPAAGETVQPLTGWTISLAAAKEYPAFRDAWESEEPVPVSGKYPDFSGFATYETTFESDGSPATLEIADVRDCALVFLNGKQAGERICPPYRFPLAPKAGKNTLRIEVATNLERWFNASDAPKFFMSLPRKAKAPAGLVGPVVLRK